MGIPADGPIPLGYLDNTNWTLGLLKAPRGYKVGRGESEEGDYREKWGISTIKIHFMKLAKN